MRTVKHAAILIVLLLALAGGSFYAGWAGGDRAGYYRCMNMTIGHNIPAGEITAEEAIAILLKAGHSHQYYIDHPERMDANESVEFHAECIGRYARVIELIKRLEGGEQ